MRARSIVLLTHFLGYFALFLAVALAVMNAVYASRPAVGRAGRAPIPALVTVLGVFGLRVLSATLNRPALFGFWPVLLVVLFYLRALLLPLIVCEALGVSDRAARRDS